MNGLNVFNNFKLFFGILLGFQLGIIAMLPFHLISSNITSLALTIILFIFWNKFGIKIIRRLSVKP